MNKVLLFMTCAVLFGLNSNADACISRAEAIKQISSNVVKQLVEQGVVNGKISAQIAEGVLVDFSSDYGTNGYNELAKALLNQPYIFKDQSQFVFSAGPRRACNLLQAAGVFAGVVSELRNQSFIVRA